MHCRRCVCALLTYSISPWHCIIALFWHCIVLLGIFFGCPLSVRRYWPYLLCLIPWNLEKTSQVEQSDELLGQWQFVPNAIFDCQTATLPRRTIDSLNEQSKIWWEQWSVHEVLSSLHFWSSYTGLSRHTQELCLFICFVLVTFSLHALAMYTTMSYRSPLMISIQLPSLIGPTLDQLLLQGTLKFDWL